MFLSTQLLSMKFLFHILWLLEVLVGTVAVDEVSIFHFMAVDVFVDMVVDEVSFSYFMATVLEVFVGTAAVDQVSFSHFWLVEVFVDMVVDKVSFLHFITCCCFC